MRPEESIPLPERILQVTLVNAGWMLIGAALGISAPLLLGGAAGALASTVLAGLGLRTSTGRVVNRVAGALGTIAAIYRGAQVGLAIEWI